MGITWDGLEKTAPELKYYMLILRHNNEEHVLPENQLKNQFGSRWTAIVNGSDKEYVAYPWDIDQGELV